MKSSSFLRCLGFFIPLLVLPTAVNAQDIPSCRTINPVPGIVCYTEHPFSARQRDEDGTKDWSFIVERWAPGWVIVDYNVIRDGGFGAVTQPTGSIVSSQGNVSIINITQRETQRLSEIRTRLQGQLQGCYPPVCGQLEGQIETIDRELETLSTYHERSVSAGGNEKISFHYTTSVDCDRYIGLVEVCGPGAGINGRVLVYQRYLGDPISLEQASTALYQQSEALINRAEQPQVPPVDPPYGPTPPQVGKPPNEQFPSQPPIQQ